MCRIWDSVLCGKMYKGNGGPVPCTPPISWGSSYWGLRLKESGEEKVRGQAQNRNMRAQGEHQSVSPISQIQSFREMELYPNTSSW